MRFLSEQLTGPLLRTALLGVVCLTIVGCSGSSSPSAASSATLPVVTIDVAPLSEPLRPKDVAAFIQVVRNLPGQTSPEFVKQDFTPLQLTNLRAELQQRQLQCQQALDPVVQGESWSRDASLQRAFKSVDIQPEAFASLAVRISCAWARQSLGPDFNLREARLRSTIHLRELVQGIENSARPVTANERQFLTQQLEAAVSLAEFLNLLEQVPPESCQVVAAAAHELRECLPQSTALPQFEQHVESRAEVIRVGHQQ
ncbi:hypothetical protein [Planctomicrobium sp. SH664]|uniref:hypothetical protein n=1 Tax=Planctomicrobium sp. SH664 TaxID=3448125 RepID=UPI003F5B62C8